MSQNIIRLRPDNIVEITIIGKQGDRIIDEMTEEYVALVKEHKLAEPRVLADATRMIGSGAGTRHASQRALKSAPFSRLAVYGAGSVFVAHIIQMILDTFGDERMKYFRSREEAMSWLSDEEK